MKLKTMTLATLALLACVGASGSANAAEYGVPYLLLDAGSSHQAGLAGGPANGTSAGLAFGVQLSDNWAIETGYRDFGDRDFSDGHGGLVSTSWTAYSLSAVPSLPLSRQLSLVGKLGVVRTSAEITDAPAFGTGKTDLVAGAGLDLRVGRAWTVRMMYEAYPRFAGSSDTMSNLSLGVKVRF